MLQEQLVLQSQRHSGAGGVTEPVTAARPGAISAAESGAAAVSTRDPSAAEPGHQCSSAGKGAGTGGRVAASCTSRRESCTGGGLHRSIPEPATLWISKQPLTGWLPSRTGSCGSPATMATTRATPARKMPPNLLSPDASLESAALVFTMVPLRSPPLYLQLKILLLLCLNFEIEVPLECLNTDEPRGRAVQEETGHKRIQRTARKIKKRPGVSRVLLRSLRSSGDFSLFCLFHRLGLEPHK